MKEKFKSMYSVVKDVGSIRTKGIWVEEIDKFVIGLGEVNVVESKTNLDAVEYTEKIKTVGDKYGIYTFYCRLGLPTVCIGCKSKADWVELRGKLKEAGLVR